MLAQNIKAVAPAAEQKRVVYLDLMRVVSVFCMVLLHIAGYAWDRVSIHTTDWQAINLYDGLMRFCVPVFVMLSGVFFLDPNRKYSFEKLFKVKVLRILTAFLFWSVAYAFVVAAVSKKPFDSDMWLEIAKEIGKGHFHLWFMFMILGLYLIVPFLRKITESRKLTEYFILLSFIFTFVLYPLSNLESCRDVLGSMLGSSNFHFTLGYVGYFVAGYYFNHYEIKKGTRAVIYILGIISVVLMITMTSYFTFKSGTRTKEWLSNLIPTNFFYSLSVFLLFKYGISKIKFGKNATKVIVWLSGMSFGVYLSHIMVRMFFERNFGFSALAFTPWASVPVVALSVFLGSLIIAFVLNKIPKLGKYIT